VPRAITTLQCSVRRYNPGNPFGPIDPQIDTQQPLSGFVDFCVDANVDAQGDPVVEVRSTTGVAGFAYIDIHERHTYDL